MTMCELRTSRKQADPIFFLFLCSGLQEDQLQHQLPVSVEVNSYNELFCTCGSRVASF